MESLTFDTRRGQRMNELYINCFLIANELIESPIHNLDLHFVECEVSFYNLFMYPKLKLCMLFLSNTLDMHPTR